MLHIKDEYIRDYAFEPEFIQRRDSLEMLKLRLENSQKKHKFPKSDEDNFVIDFHPSIIDAEVHSFCSVNIARESLRCESRAGP